MALLSAVVAAAMACAETIEPGGGAGRGATGGHKHELSGYELTGSPATNDSSGVQYDDLPLCTLPSARNSHQNLAGG